MPPRPHIARRAALGSLAHRALGTPDCPACTGPAHRSTGVRCGFIFIDSLCSSDDEGWVTLTTEDPQLTERTPTPPRSDAARPRVTRIDVPESRGYRLKKRLLGPPLHTEELDHERLGKPTALAVFASDNLSSSAYATEEILRVLIPVDRRRRLLAGRADHRRPARGARLPDPLLPPDDQGVPERRRRLHRHQGQLRQGARRWWPASRCSPTTS